MGSMGSTGGSGDGVKMGTGVGKGVGATLLTMTWTEREAVPPVLEYIVTRSVYAPLGTPLVSH